MSPVPNRFHGREMTFDSFYRGKIRLHQPRHGWRFSVDAAALASFIGKWSATQVVEIGGGCGIISLLLLLKGDIHRVTVYEIQPFYARLCEINARANRLGDRLKVVCGDYLDPGQAHPPVDLIFANPPFFNPASGRISPNQEIALAKWEIRLDFDSLLNVARDRLAAGGQLIMILPKFREEEYRAKFARFKFSVGRYRSIKPFFDRKAERFLVQLSVAPVSEERMSPLILFSEAGIYSEEMMSILRGQ